MKRLASAGMMPWIARDLMQWPVATSGQGVIDLVIQSIVSCVSPCSDRLTRSKVPRATMVSAITGAEKGEAYWMQCQHYYKGTSISLSFFYVT